MKALKVLEIIFEIAIVISVISIIGLFGGIENGYTFTDTVPYFIASMIVLGIACLGMRYVETKEDYLIRRNRRH